MGKLKDKIPSHYDLAYAEGYLQGLLDSSWTCGDCGNVYSRDIDFCPNVELDEAKVRVRYMGSKA